MGNHWANVYRYILSVSCPQYLSRVPKLKSFTMPSKWLQTGRQIWQNNTQDKSDKTILRTSLDKPDHTCSTCAHSDSWRNCKEFLITYRFGCIRLQIIHIQNINLNNGQWTYVCIRYHVFTVYICKTVCRINYSCCFWRLVAGKYSNLASEVFKDSGTH